MRSDIHSEKPSHNRDPRPLNYSHCSPPSAVTRAEEPAIKAPSPKGRAPGPNDVSQSKEPKPLPIPRYLLTKPASPRISGKIRGSPIGSASKKAGKNRPRSQGTPAPRTSQNRWSIVEQRESVNQPPVTHGMPLETDEGNVSRRIASKGFAYPGIYEARIPGAIITDARNSGANIPEASNSGASIPEVRKEHLPGDSVQEPICISDDFPLPSSANMKKVFLRCSASLEMAHDGPIIHVRDILHEVLRNMAHHGRAVLQSSQDYNVRNSRFNLCSDVRCEFLHGSLARGGPETGKTVTPHM